MSQPPHIPYEVLQAGRTSEIFRVTDFLVFVGVGVIAREYKVSRMTVSRMFRAGRIEGSVFLPPDGELHPRGRWIARFPVTIAPVRRLSYGRPSHIDLRSSYGVREVARRLDCTQAWVRELAQHGDLRGARKDPRTELWAFPRPILRRQKDGTITHVAPLP